MTNSNTCIVCGSDMVLSGTSGGKKCYNCKHTWGKVSNRV